MALSFLIPLSFILLNFNSECFAQTGSTIRSSSSITAGSNDSWVSPSGDFAFGFYHLPNGLYLVGIWFDKTKPKTLVWAANRDNPAPTNSVVQLNNTGQFVLSFPDGTIHPIIPTQTPATSGQMQDDGNFVLKDFNSAVIGQSFDSPTDTLLPGQILTVDKKMFSIKKILDFSTGNFMLQMQRDGNLVLSNYQFSNIGYWFTIQTNIDSTVLVFDNSSSLMYLTTQTNPIGRHIFRKLTVGVPDPIKNYYHRATIGVHGDFRQYVYSKIAGREWRRVWGAMSDPCLVNTVCGLNGLCKSSDNDTVTCGCLPGFVPMDQTNVVKGCRPEVVINYCNTEDSGMNFTIQVIDDVDIDFPPPPGPGHFSDLAYTYNVDVEGCKTAIRGDCYAMAATLNNSRCVTKRTPLMNARNTSSTKGVKALIRVPSPLKNSLPNKPKDKSNYRKFLEIGNIVAGVLAFCFGVVALLSHPVTGRLMRRKQFSSASAIGINFREFTFKELVDATDGFHKIIGRGSSGKVFRGNLHIDGVDVEIAVKLLDIMTERTEKEFVTELTIIGRTYHKNLVRLLGYCTENENQLLLVYELMPKGALSRFLFGSGENPNWIQRVEIAMGIARGLAYLHEGCETQIIHCDVKPQNVLLDANYTTKIADFGISKLLKKDQTRTNTEARGTVGHMAPEWLRGAPVTAKVDVYSYGVMLLEIICCRRHIELDRIEEESEEEDLVLSNWVLCCAAAGKLETVVGDKAEILKDFKRFERMAMVGLWCIHPDASQRPSMKKVTQMLEGTAEVETPPLLL